MPIPHTDVTPPPVVAQVASAPRPTGGALTFGVGLSGGSSVWSGDGLGDGAVSFGLRLAGVVTPYAGLGLGYARVDQRLLTRLSIGVDDDLSRAERDRLADGLACGAP